MGERFSPEQIEAFNKSRAESDEKALIKGEKLTQKRKEGVLSMQDVLQGEASGENIRKTEWEKIQAEQEKIQAERRKENTEQTATLYGKSLENIYTYASKDEDFGSNTLFWGDKPIYHGDDTKEMFDLLVTKNIDPTGKGVDELKELLQDNKETENRELARITEKIQSSLSEEEWEKVKNYLLR